MWERAFSEELMKISLKEMPEFSLADVSQMTITGNFEILKDPEIWIADTGTSNHSTFSRTGVINVIESDLGMTQGATGEAVAPKSAVDIPSLACDRYGNQQFEVTMTGVSLIPEGDFNLFSITRLLLAGWKLGGNASSIWVTKGQRTIRFDIRVTTAKGTLFFIFMKRQIKKTEVSALLTTGTTLSLTKAHTLLGHCNEEATKAAAGHFGWKITRGSKMVCQSCAESKAKQKNVHKISTGTKATVPNGRLYHD